MDVDSKDLPSSNGGNKPGHDSDEGDIDEDLIEVIYDDDLEDDDDDDDDLDQNYGTDLGELADVEDEGEDSDSIGMGLEAFTGQKANIVLKGHLDQAVFCCSFDSTSQMLITGGEDDVANVWDSSSIESRFPVFKSRGHKDSVISASFSHDSSYFSSADLSGIVKVWRTSTMKGNAPAILTLETGDMTWSFWHFGSNVLFAGCEDGSIYMWKVPSGECKILTGGASKCECGILLPDGKRLAAGYENGAVKLFDLKSGQVQHTLYNPTSRSCAVLSIDKSQNHQIVATGNFRGRCHVYNTLTGKLINTLQCSSPNAAADDDTDGSADSVESIAFSPNKNMDYLAAGTVSGHVVLWEANTLTERARIKQDAGLTKLVWDVTWPVFYTGGLDGVVRVIDARTCKIERLLGRHRSEVLDLGVSKDGTKLVSASEDGSTFIFNLEQA